MPVSTELLYPLTAMAEIKSISSSKLSGSSSKTQSFQREAGVGEFHNEAFPLGPRRL